MQNRRNKDKTDIASLNKTRQSGYGGMYALTKKVYCGVCGTEIHRITWKRKRNGRETTTIVWKCKKRHQKVSYCKDSHIIKEDALHNIIHSAVQQSIEGLGRLTSTMTDNIESVLSQSEGASAITSLIREKRG